MKFSMIIVFIIMIIALIGTMALGGKSDENYSGAVRGNLTRLTWIYAILGIVLALGVGLYVVIV